ncbi:L-aspartate oxidase [Kineococcus radiotolerans]|uniref:L-aspartate oxidase n=1 Tax=Kineococcus radiotolerans TaxID=131568 RepID=A0A7W4TN46_KINRA|nr:L-aspartate oxidase [Kineococcus radiotolerans]MBB2901870.1 L-aspartate oxidase [Kineococcus radiotolerans]
MNPRARAAEELRTDVLVVGAGIAGLTAALEAARTGRVVLATKTALGDGSTHYAQGGIAAAVDAADVAAHVADTLAAGAGLSSPAAVRALCAGGPAAVRVLAERGVEFDRGSTGGWALGLEAAHSTSRILHAGGDRTGAAISAALAAAVRRSDVTVREQAFLAGLRTEDGRVVGADLLVGDEAEGPVHVLRVTADAVVLATGGAGQLFSRTTNPAVATADGLAAAFRAGAAVADLEFFQFHPTVAALPSPFLVSEAVRGEGAVLLDAAGHRFADRADPRGELAPRDVVARAIAAAMAEHGGAPVVLDATGVSARLGRPFAERFPGIAQLCAEAGLDPETTPIPVTPAAHYWMGGIRTDAAGRTTVPGLWAAGEVACSGVHGANRLASNSLLEALVTGGQVAEDVRRGPGAARFPDDEVVEVPGPALPLAAHVGRRDLQAALWEHAGVVRDAAGLAVAAKLLTPQEDPVEIAPDDLGVPRSTREDANLVLAARLLVAAATAREESLGAHFRSDDPTTPAHPVRRSFRRTA